MVLYMSSDKFLLVVESCDLSQADKSITRVFSFPSFNFWMINYSYTQKSYLAIGQNCFGHLITQKFVSWKSKQFSHFFWWEVILRGLTKFILQKVQASGLRDRKRSSNTHHFGKEYTLIILLSAWKRSRDSKAKRNLSKHMWRT